MKNTLKITITTLIGITLLYTACKKNDAKITDTQKTTSVSQSEVAKKMALSVYMSLSTQLASAHISHSSAGGKDKLTIMGQTILTKCGDFETTPTNRTVINGDTTRKYTGNSKFTYLCDGTLWANGYNINAYALDDTMHTVVSGKGFENVYDDLLNFHVKASDGIYFTTAGSASAAARFNVLNKNVLSESHYFSTKYLFQEVVGRRVQSADKTTGKFVLGKVYFDYEESHDYKTSPDKNSKAGNSGYMVFLDNDTLESYFKIEGTTNSYYKYVINLLTGEVSKPERIN